MLKYKDIQNGRKFMGKEEGIVMRGNASLLRVLSLALAFMLIIWSGLAITSGRHFYGATGLAYSWIMGGLGFGILLASFGYIRVLRPPYLYVYIGFFALMFLREMGWIAL